jgi:predicted metalloendopeptidase
MFTADPSARIFDGRLYLYTSHDRDGATSYNMVDWWVDIDRVEFEKRANVLIAQYNALVP